MTEITQRLTTALADRYRIEDHVGQGGMATVYLAHDVKHDRKVALKVLRPELAAVIGAERFLNEIKVTANLQHPHILPLHDSGNADSFLYYVMPYVEGESLREKLDREKQLGIEDAIEITRAIASALDYAHRQDVIHRDIKPENILMHDGQALVADFGIALAVKAAGGARLTETGLSLGTPHYMSPEQAMGDRELDARSDVYSLGAVLYEMLVGDPPYSGNTAQAIVAKVITEKAPSITAIRDTVPGHVAATVHKSLAKLPADRFASTAEFAEALVTPGAVPLLTTAAVAEPQMQTASSRDRRLLGALGATAVFAGLAVWGWLRAPETTGAGPPARFTIERLSAVTVANFGRQIAISPDGTRIVYRGVVDGIALLMQRRIDDDAITPISGTEGGRNPFFSPDGEWLGFVDASGLKRIARSGGPALTIAAFDGARDPHWGAGGTIVFWDRGGVVHRVSGAGGPPEVVARPAQRVTTLRYPELLPDGEVAIVTVYESPERIQIGVLDMATGAVDIVVNEGTDAHYLPSGHLIYGHPDGALFAVPFDLRRRRVTGPPTPVLDDVNVLASGATQFAVAGNGTAVYVLGGDLAARLLVMVDMAGQEQPLPAPPRAYRTPRFSTDGRRVATSIEENIQVWDVQLGTLTQLTFEGTNLYPFWSRDGATITFSTERPGTTDMDPATTPADGSGGVSILHTLSSAASHPQAWSLDGRTLLTRTRIGGQLDLRILQFGDSVEVRPYLEAPWSEFAASLSPNGHWVVYVSNESGVDEIYVRAFPDPGQKWLVSQGGGAEPLWSPDGRRLYYWNGQTLMAANVQATNTFAVQDRVVVLQGERYVRFGLFANYDIHPDGQQFIMVKGEEGTTATLTIVVNWFEELKARMANVGAGN